MNIVGCPRSSSHQFPPIPVTQLHYNTALQCNPPAATQTSQHKKLFGKCNANICGWLLRGGGGKGHRPPGPPCWGLQTELCVLFISWTGQIIPGSEVRVMKARPGYSSPHIMFSHNGGLQMRCVSLLGLPQSGTGFGLGEISCLGFAQTGSPRNWPKQWFCSSVNWRVMFKESQWATLSSSLSKQSPVHS